MKVTLVNFTPHALETLIFTKGTRLNMTANAFAEILEWSPERKLAELEYMRHTIQSQFEFVDYIFQIEGVSRAFTHQLVRHRVGTSFAQQAQRVVDMTGFDYITSPSIASEEQQAIYNNTMVGISARYARLIEVGVRTQDARGVLPTNISTNITFKANLRTLHDMALKRLCVKTQGEFQDVFRAMRRAVLTVHPWAEAFIRVWCAQHGTCQFHTFPVEDCPIKGHIYNPYAGCSYSGSEAYTPDRIQAAWEVMPRTEAQPVIRPVPQQEG